MSEDFTEKWEAIKQNLLDESPEDFRARMKGRKVFEVILGPCYVYDDPPEVVDE